MDKLKIVLDGVQKPARYAGGEYGQIIKTADISVRFALCFPDVYEIGMSHLGLQILYGLINQRPDAWCERVFAPWGDMEASLRKHNMPRGLPLCALESGDPLNAFDIIGFSLQYELCYTNVLQMLELGGVPLYAAERKKLENLVIAGGGAAFNPEPMADFIDLFVIGEGEEVTGEIIDLYAAAKKGGASKEEFLTRAASIAGVYVPSLYDVSYDGAGLITEITPRSNAPERVRKRVVADLDNAYFPSQMVIPSMEAIHDRSVLELFRGCIRGCRFCQAGHITRPVRARSVDTLIKQAAAQCEHSGRDEIGLLSLSSSDYPGLGELCDRLLDYCEPRRISLSLPSLRADNFSTELLAKVQKVRKSGLTFAPEAGTQRLRDVINKNITGDDLTAACAAAFAAGYGAVKLYFMLGLPTETDEDIEGIAGMAADVLYTWRQRSSNRARGLRLTVSTSSFVPKAHTPFQWAAMDTADELGRKVSLLRGQIKSKNITYNWHEPRVSVLEAVFARGDRRLGAAIYEAYKLSCRFDSWDECLKYETWMRAFDFCGIDPAYYANRARAGGEILPWDHIDSGVSREFLLRGYHDALAGKTAPDCRIACAGCGACG